MFTARSLTLGLLAASLALIAGCGGGGSGLPGGNGTTRVRIVNVSPDSPNLDVLIAGRFVATDLGYEQIQNYQDLPAGNNQRFMARQANSSTVLADTQIDLADTNSNYTVFVADTAAFLTPIVLVDDLAPPAGGNFSLRVANMATSSGDVDVYITPPGVSIGGRAPEIPAVPFLEASANIELSAGTYEIRFTDSGTKNVILDLPSVTFLDGKVQTLVFLDAQGGGTPFEALLMDDAD